jgi:hypothetical protein
MRPHWNFFKESDTSMGVFYPLHYVLAAFDSEARADEVQRHFLDAGFAAEDVTAVSGSFLVKQLEATGGSSLLERIGQDLVRGVGTEFGYLDDDRRTADRGGAFLFVYAPDDDTTARITTLLKRNHPIYARRYNKLGVHRIIYPNQSVL